MESIIHIKNLKKRFPTKEGFYEAVRGINLSIAEGEIFGFLGPNGAGKTTTLRMLTTLLPPDEGEAYIAGFHLKKEQDGVRRSIGYVSQSGGGDTSATGLENLVLQGQLQGLVLNEAKKRAQELIDILSLNECADRFLRTYSGGQRRRLDIALGMMHRPKVLFLDEPTTGLDPQNRANLWDQIKKMRENGTTVFLTSHYLDEIDLLSDRLAIMDKGEIVAEGTPRDLKKQIAGDVVSIGLKHDFTIDSSIIDFFKGHEFVRDVTCDASDMHLYVENGEESLPHILRLIDKKQIGMRTIGLSIPTLNDVFLRKTGRSLRDEERALK